MSFRTSDSPQTIPGDFEDEILPRSTPMGGRYLATGQIVERYEVREWLGEGATATVYRVRHRQLESDYALKVLHVLHPELLGRLITEGQLQSQLEHPHIVRVHDVLEVGTAPALLMDYVAGPSLADRLRDGAFGFDEAEKIFRQILDAVAYAHSHGVIHRDLKPANVLLTKRAGVMMARVTDFGIAKHLTPTAPAATMTGGLLGTLEYMAPEQIRGAGQVDARADIFALGVLLYEMCAGRRPFAGEHLVRLLSAIDRAEYTAPEVVCPAMPESLQRAIKACLVSRPQWRVPDCTTLRQILDGQSWESPGADQEGYVDGAMPSAVLSRKQKGLFIAAVLLLVVVSAGLVERHLRLGEQSRQSEESSREFDAYMKASRLAALGWERIAHQPGEALALFRAADAVGATLGMDPVLTPELLVELKRQGAAVTQIPFGEQVSQVEYSPDGAFVAAGSLSGQVAVWESATGKEVSRFDAEVRSRLMGLSFTPDGKSLLVLPSSGDPSPGRAEPARLFDVATGKLKHSFSHGGRTAVFRITSDSRLGASLGYDFRVFLWDMETGAPLRPLTGAQENEPAACLAFSPDGRYLAVGYSTLPTRASWSLYDLSGGEVRERRLSVPAELVGLRECRVAFSADGTMLIGATGHGLIVWDPTTGEIVSSVPTVNWRILAIDPDGHRVIYGTPQGGIMVRSLPDLGLKGELDGYRGAINRVAYGPVALGGEASFQGSWFATGGTGGTLGLWSGQAGQMLGQLTGNRSWILDLAVGKTPRGLEVASAGRDGVVRSWVLPTSPARVDGMDEVDDGTRQPIVARHLCANGRHFVFGTRDHRVLTRFSGQEHSELLGAFEAPLWDVHRNDQGHIAVSVVGRGIYVFDGGDEPRHVPIDEQRVWLSPSSDRLVVGGYHSVHAVDLESGDITDFPFDELIRLTAIDWKNGRALAVDNRNYLHVVTLDETARRQVFPLSGDEGADLALSPDAGFALVGFWGGGAEIWDLDAGERVALLEGHRDSVTRVAFSPDGRLAATGSEDHTARLWDARTGEPAAELRIHTGQILDLTFASSGKLLATASLDQKICLWAVSSGSLQGCHELTAAPRSVRLDEEAGLVRVLDQDDRLWAWAFEAETAKDPNASINTGSLTNLRVCEDSLTVVPILPYPDPNTFWAPEEVCRTERNTVTTD